MLRTQSEGGEIRIVGEISTVPVIMDITDVAPEQHITVAQKADGTIFLLKDVGAHWLWVSLKSSDIGEEEIDSALSYEDAIYNMRTYLDDGASEQEVYIFETQYEMLQHFLRRSL